MENLLSFTLYGLPFGVYGAIAYIIMHKYKTKWVDIKIRTIVRNRSLNRCYIHLKATIQLLLVGGENLNNPPSIIAIVSVSD